MNTKQTELSDEWDLPDSRKRNLIKELAIVILSTCFFMILLMVALCHADKIDTFFQGLYKLLAL